MSSQPPHIFRAPTSETGPQDEDRPCTAEILSGNDLVIPAHLLQAAATSGSSSRDAGEPTNWQPRRQSTVVDNPILRQFSREEPPVSQQTTIRRTLSAPNKNFTASPPQQPAPTANPRASYRADHVVYAAGDRESRESRERQEDQESRRNNKRASLPTRSSYRWSRQVSYGPPSTGESVLESMPEKPAFNRRASKVASHDFAANPIYDPFIEETATIVESTESSESSTSGSKTDQFSTRPNSMLSVPDKTSSRESWMTNNRQSWIRGPEVIHVPPRTKRRSTLGTLANAVLPEALQMTTTNNSANGLTRSNTMRKTFDKAKMRGKELQRNKWAQLAFEYGMYALILLFIYFVLIGVPLWKGAVWWLHWVVANKFVFAGGFGITLGLALFYAFAPLLILFENDPPAQEMTTETKVQSNVKDTALLIPCYKSANLIGATLEAALKIFPPSHIYVIANGNSPEPLDNTEEVCQPYGVNHIWSPIGCKLVAQFVGCYAAKNFKNVLLIDDDCALPENFPVVTDRLRGKVMCLGYTIKSVGPNSSKGNYCQQAQDLEYKLSGLQREFAGKVGSATFPHGAIALWDRQLLVKTFNEHPGFSVSEDWFFGHVARELGSRITMCSQVFVETETPTAVFFSSGGSRGGFGEMTIFKQRFKRWNFFFVNGMYYNMKYILCSWKLGWWEIGAKIFVFQEVYETLLYLLTPFVLPISFEVRPSFCGLLLGSTIVMYFLNVLIFNELHLRRKNERIGWFVIFVYYLPYKIILTGINVASCYWSLWKYARYFAKRHPKVTEDEKAVEIVVRLEEDAATKEHPGMGRRLTVRTMRNSSIISAEHSAESTLLPDRRSYISMCDPKFTDPAMTIDEKQEERSGSVDSSANTEDTTEKTTSLRESWRMDGETEEMYSARVAKETEWI